MSFNFSDKDDDEDDFDLDAFDDTGLLALASRERAEVGAAAAAAASTAASTSASAPSPPAACASKGKANNENADEAYDFGEESDDDGGDWDNIDWEDADEEDDADDDSKGPEDGDTALKFPTQPVMINFGKTRGRSNNPDDQDEGQYKKSADGKEDDDNDDESKPSKRKRKKPTTRVLRNVPYETQQLVLNVRRSQMLCDIVRCMQCSFVWGGGSVDNSEEDRLLLSHVAYSLIPQEFHHPDLVSKSTASTTIPTKQQLQQFSQWFFQFVNGAGDRRRAALQRNVAQGAAAATNARSRRRSRRQSSSEKARQSTKKRAQSPNMKTQESDSINEASSNCAPSYSRNVNSQSPRNLIQTLLHLSPRYDEDPQLFIEDEGIDAVDRINAGEKARLFLTMVRSLGWRARFVTSINPMPLQLTVDHPMFATQPAINSQPQPELLDVKPPAKRAKSDDEFGDLHKLLGFIHEGGMLNIQRDRSSVTKRKKQKRSANVATTGDTIDLVSSGDDANTSGKKGATPSATTADDVNDSLLSWVEVLCRSDKPVKRNNSRSKMISTRNSPKAAAMWVPIHPEQESFDKPEEVESILGWMEVNGKAKYEQEISARKKRKGKWGSGLPKSLDRRHANTYSRKYPVSYVLAVEHSPLKVTTPASGDSMIQMRGVRFTDVTPRYANTWARTLRLRGASGREIAAGGGKCVDKWWEVSLEQLNRHCRPKNRRGKSPSKSPVRSVTKTKTKAGKEVDMVELESSDDEKNRINCPHSSDSDEHEGIEAKELTGTAANEKIPTSKAAFKQSPFYVIPSVLNSQEVLYPDARKRICGVFKGELVYRRSDVSKAQRAKKWLYQGRKVRESEMGDPVKQVKARKKPVAKGFKALASYGVSEEAQEEMIASMSKNSEKEKEMDDLYGIWQTEAWSPPYVGPADPIPTNEYKNVELALINPGLTHMDQVRLAPIARKLGIPYAPCMLGYDGHGGNRTATIRGIVVHDHNVALMQEAYTEWESHAAEKERQERRNMILKRWKRLVVGILTKERLEREYG